MQDSVTIELDDPISRRLDSTFLAYYFDKEDFTTDTLQLNTFNFQPNEIPVVPDSIIVERLTRMSEMSPISFSPDKRTIAFARLYAEKKRKLTSRMLGLAELYFPVFEELLIKNQMPEELKYLPIIESALNAKATSPMGAAGLWQFMPGTAKQMGLEVSYYIDERRELYQSTEAACKYLKDAYNIYKDWHLAIASYNSGAGNVNKAIRRSNGKTNFWEIIQYLPRETQNYVPALLGCAYAMKYHREHNIYPIEPSRRNFEIDTVWINQRVKFNVVEKYLKVSIKELEYLNPAYPKLLVPDTEEDRPLVMPIVYIGLFESNKDSIYAKSKRSSSFPTDSSPKRTKGEEKNNEREGFIYYTIRKGDTLWDVAQRYDGVTMDDLKSENSHLNFKKLKTGTKIRIPK